jgi:hypothetical protein
MDRRTSQKRGSTPLTAAEEPIVGARAQRSALHDQGFASDFIVGFVRFSDVRRLQVQSSCGTWLGKRQQETMGPSGCDCTESTLKQCVLIDLLSMYDLLEDCSITSMQWHWRRVMLPQCGDGDAAVGFVAGFTSSGEDVFFV